MSHGSIHAPYHNLLYIYRYALSVHTIGEGIRDQKTGSPTRGHGYVCAASFYKISLFSSAVASLNLRQALLGGMIVLTRLMSYVVH
jgi:hypothetical protein